MPDVLLRVLLGGIAAAVVAGAGYRRGALGGGGAGAAVLVGAAVVGGGGWWWGALMVAFFATSSALPKAVGRRGAGAAAAVAARGNRRDAVQVLANGGLPTLLATLGPVLDRPLAFAAYAGALAAVAADTWATEIGVASGTPPRSVVTGRIVPPGTSGGVTALGTAGSVLGSLAIGALAALGVAAGWVAAPVGAGAVLAVVAGAGAAGALADSLLGATVQAAYVCPRCGAPTERRVHGCGTPTRLIRGYPAVTNDVVNLACAATGAVVAAGVAAFA